MVAENTGQIWSGKIAERRTNGLEGHVAWGKDGDIRCSVDSLCQLGSGEGTRDRSQVRGNGSGGDIGGWRQEAINHMDDAVVVGDVL